QHRGSQAQRPPQRALVADLRGDVAVPARAMVVTGMAVPVGRVAIMLVAGVVDGAHASDYRPGAWAETITTDAARTGAPGRGGDAAVPRSAGLHNATGIVANTRGTRPCPP